MKNDFFNFFLEISAIEISSRKKNSVIGTKEMIPKHVVRLNDLFKDNDGYNNQFHTEDRLHSRQGSNLFFLDHKRI